MSLSHPKLSKLDNTHLAETIPQLAQYLAKHYPDKNTLEVNKLPKCLEVVKGFVNTEMDRTLRTNRLVSQPYSRVMAHSLYRHWKHLESTDTLETYLRYDFELWLKRIN